MSGVFGGFIPAYKKIGGACAGMNRRPEGVVLGVVDARFGSRIGNCEMHDSDFSSAAG